ncbi:MAG: orotate phosphoribosyltransferase [Gemmatimonadetes bacterium]|nr:orotate phosphoribosyltransferase [Gemmatimonadota bacterium]
MKKETLMELFRESGALQRGHFELSSGLHSDVYFQSALVLQQPERAEVLGRALGAVLRDVNPDVVVGPALGGIIIAWEVARALEVRGIFTERKDGKMSLRRGFRLNEGERVLVVEDVVTTGRSTRETVEVLEAAGGEVVGVASIVDRSGANVEFGVPFQSLMSLPVQAWEPSQCPLCREGTALTKPGSRPGVPAGS